MDEAILREMVYDYIKALPKGEYLDGRADYIRFPECGVLNLVSVLSELEHQGRIRMIPNTSFYEAID
ncbi:MAG: hypothetical protein KHZ29_09670 [Desulfovibrionaceae bacterium]|nr:hypothetical protein [Desulfovibrionaceae bacterium]